MSGFLDPKDHYKVKLKMKELDNLITQYNKIYKIATDEIESIYKAKIYAVSIIEEVRDYINTLANTPKEYKDIVFSPNIDSHNYRTTYDEMKKSKRKKDTINYCVVATFGVAAMLGGPIAWGTFLVTIGVTGKKEKKNNEITIEKIDAEINKIHKEIANLYSKDNDFISEKDYIYKHASFIKKKLSKIQHTGIKNYTQFSNDQKISLCDIFANVEELVKRLDGSV